MKEKTVCILQSRLTHYRVSLFQILKQRLAESGIKLSLVYSQGSKDDLQKDDSGSIDWAVQVNSRRWYFGGVQLLWQAALEHTKNASLVILPNENRLLLNYLLLLRRPIYNQRLAFWGHGKNFQKENTNWLKDKWKRIFLCMPDWWFGYTHLTKEILIQAGYPESKITILQNTIDTKELFSHSERIAFTDKQSLRKELKLEGNNVGVFCGSLYPGKRIDLLLASAEQLRKRIKDFELIIIGSGPDEHLVLEAAKRNPGVRYVGKRIGYEKALYMSLGHVFLLPHIVGLAILDSFALGLPLITMDNGSHSPEIVYLRHSANGLMCKNNLNSFVDETVALLNDRGRLQAMAAECKTDARLYTVENMVARFADGIIACLNSDKS